MKETTTPPAPPDLSPLSYERRLVLTGDTLARLISWCWDVRVPPGAAVDTNGEDVHVSWFCRDAVRLRSATEAVARVAVTRASLDELDEWMQQVRPPLNVQRAYDDLRAGRYDDPVVAEVAP